MLSTAIRNKGFQISNWKPFAKNTLQAFFDVTTPSGIVIHGLTLHQKNAARWVGMPGRAYTKEDGTTSYTPVIEFASREAGDKFRDQVLQAIDAAGLGGHG